MIDLTSTAVRFRCDPEHACWDLVSNDDEVCRIERARLAVQYRVGSERAEAFRQIWDVTRIDGPELTVWVHGVQQQVIVNLSTSLPGFSAKVEFALPEEHPFLLWRITLWNRGELPVAVERLDLLTGDSPEAGSAGCQISLPGGPKQTAFYSNGWQSWSYSGTYLNGQRMRRSRLGPLQNPMVINPGTSLPNARGTYSGDFFGVVGDRDRRRAILAGFLSQTQHFGSIAANLNGRPSICLWANGDGALLEPGASITTDWAVLSFIDVDDPDPLGPYLEAVARENQVGALGEVPVGWCSWYHFYQKVTAADIERNLRGLRQLEKELPFKIMQIDDGFEEQVGDWRGFRATFPHGVKPLAEQICEAGKIPGLWLAPFIVHPKAKLMKEHPEWILRDQTGKPVNAGYVWDSFTRGLDLTAPGALDFACETVHRAAHDWGFSFLKLDFLYAAALPGKRHDSTLTRAQVLRRGLEALREAAGPKTTMLGCGVPLGSAVGLFEQMRISCDVSGDWTPAYFNLHLPFKPEPHMPSARNALQNTLVRAPFHRRLWINDPDCLLARENTRLTKAEIQSMATAIALTGGSLLLSDDLPDEMTAWLRIPQLLIPVIGRRARVMDWFDEHTPRRLRLDLDGPAGPYSLLALFNWSNRPEQAHFDLKEFGIKENGTYATRLFWQKRTQLVEWGLVEIPPIPAHGVALLALRPIEDGKPAYIGSDLHISQGMELTEWQANKHCVKLSLDLGRHAGGEFELYLLRAPSGATMNGKALSWIPAGDGKYRFPVDFQGWAKIEVQI